MEKTYCNLDFMSSLRKYIEDRCQKLDGNKKPTKPKISKNCNKLPPSAINEIKKYSKSCRELFGQPFQTSTPKQKINLKMLSCPTSETDISSISQSDEQLLNKNYTSHQNLMSCPNLEDLFQKLNQNKNMINKSLERPQKLDICKFLSKERKNQCQKHKPTRKRRSKKNCQQLPRVWREYKKKCKQVVSQENVTPRKIISLGIPKDMGWRWNNSDLLLQMSSKKWRPGMVMCSVKRRMCEHWQNAICKRLNRENNCSKKDHKSHQFKYESISDLSGYKKTILELDNCSKVEEKLRDKYKTKLPTTTSMINGNVVTKQKASNRIETNVIKTNLPPVLKTKLSDDRFEVQIPPGNQSKNKVVPVELLNTDTQNAIGKSGEQSSKNQTNAKKLNEPVSQKERPSTVRIGTTAKPSFNVRKNVTNPPVRSSIKETEKNEKTQDKGKVDNLPSTKDMDGKPKAATVGVSRVLVKRTPK